jgi:hypothetical protein
MSLGSESVCDRRDRNAVRTGFVPVREPMDNSGQRQSPRVRESRQLQRLHNLTSGGSRGRAVEFGSPYRWLAWVCDRYPRFGGRPELVRIGCSRSAGSGHQSFAVAARLLPEDPGQRLLMQQAGPEHPPDLHL